jgi:hydroxymethylpyrimidine/phosphomethylpyrimidine kinase
LNFDSDELQADLKTFTSLGCYGASVVTALTAQNTKGVQAVHTVPPSFVEEQVRLPSLALTTSSSTVLRPRDTPTETTESFFQIRSVLDDIDVAAIKTGMLANRDVVRAVAHSLKALLPSRRPLLVLDPVCVSEHEALDVLIEELLPLATVLTPNTAEAEALLLMQRRRRGEHARASGETETADTSSCRTTISSIEDMMRASRELCALGPRAVLVKGGHVTQNGGMRIADAGAAILSATVAATKEDSRVDSVAAKWDCLVPHEANMEILFQAAAQGPAVRDFPVVVDVLYAVSDGDGGGGDGRGEGRGRHTLFVRPFLDSTSTHGTGCTLSAALACALARGTPRTHFTRCRSRTPAKIVDSILHMSHATVIEAVEFAGTYTHHGIATAFPIGSGHGPLNHMHTLLPRALHR